ncbi:L-threonylcarbamoyladenylate synthase [Aureococcus anophagefferens]|nr:L-threonylcarbamoyladenylate synthase [Aureococcus anophagefferens]
MDKIARSLAQRQAVTTVPRDAFYTCPEDYPGPAVDYSKGYATFEVRNSAVVYKVPPLDVFGLDWRLGEGPPHTALSIARMGRALVGERIELVNFQGKTGSWVEYEVLNFDPDVLRRPSVLAALLVNAAHAYAPPATRRPRRAPGVTVAKYRGPKQEMDYLDVLADGSDAWRLDDDIIGTLNRGGVGVIPTDTSYSFVAPSGAARMIYKGGARRWKRDTVGVRIPDDPVCAHILSQVDGPLFCSSVPTSDDGDQLVCRLPLEGDAQTWCALVDFVVDAGARPIEGSTVYDLASDDAPAILREGLGPPVH